MVRVIVVAVSLIPLVFGVAASAAPSPSRAGIYSNVRLIEEAGDVLGMRVDYRPGLKPVVIVTSCEGLCDEAKTLPVTINGDHIAFTECDAMVDQNHRPVPCEPIHYIGVFRHDGALVITIAGVTGFKEVLHKARRPKPH